MLGVWSSMSGCWFAGVHVRHVREQLTASISYVQPLLSPTPRHPQDGVSVPVNRPIGSSTNIVLFNGRLHSIIARARACYVR